MSEQVDTTAVGRGGRQVDEWIVVIEAAMARSGGSFEFRGVQDLLGRLRKWHPSGLYNPDRYAIQLRIAASTPSEALGFAVGCHDQAARAVGLPPSSVARAEVLTVGEFESGLAGAPETDAAPPPWARHALICDELYTTTRALLRVSTPGEITDLLVRFVTGVGGSVTVGECHPDPGTVVVELTGGDGVPLHAVADNMSVAGMIIEQSLPSLVEDARLVGRQLHGISN